MLELRDITFRATDSPTRPIILDHVSLCIAPGTLTAITGPNGSGKSTLAQLIMGIKAPTSGRIYCEGEDIIDLSVTERANLGIAFAFQQPVVFKGITIYSLLCIATGERISESEAGEYLQQVGLDPAEYLPREIDAKLSGGELKRIELASVLARDAAVTIYDEPEAGIDLWSFEDLAAVLEQQKSLKRTSVIISHQERILRIADQIIVLEAGKIKTQGRPESVLSQIVGDKHEIK